VRDDGPSETTGSDDLGAERSGDGSVDAALTLLGGLDGVPVREHVAVFDAVHGALQDRLSDTEE